MQKYIQSGNYFIAPRNNFSRERRWVEVYIVTSRGLNVKICMSDNNMLNILSVLNTLHTGHDESCDLNPMHHVQATTKVVFEKRVVY
jgi:hypothetical protein